jgi:hypothetical protein
MSDLGLVSGKVASPRMYCILSPGQMNNDIIDGVLSKHAIEPVKSYGLHDGYTLFVLRDELPPMIERLIDDYSWTTTKNERELAHFLRAVEMGTPSKRIFTTHPPHKKD